LALPPWFYKGNATSFNDTGLSSGTAYYYKLYAENYSYYSSGVTASACTVLAAPTTTGASRCGSGSLTLSTSGSGGTLKWYSDAGLTTQVATGTSYSPELSTTTTFYVTETSASGCVSPASTVTGTINPLPTALNASYNRGQGASLKVKISDLTSDTLQSLGTATHGTVSNDTTYIFYVPLANDNSNDSFTYATANNYCSKQGTITVTVVVATGQAQTITVVGGKATVTCAGIPGCSYTVQRGTDVSFPEPLTDVLTTNLPTTPTPVGVFTVLDELGDPPPSQAYYRLKYNP
jgi:hypothetical protein